MKLKIKWNLFLGKLAWYVAEHLPSEVVIRCFIRVHASATRLYPDKTPDQITFSKAYRAWNNVENL